MRRVSSVFSFLCCLCSFASLLAGTLHFTARGALAQAPEVLFGVKEVEHPTALAVPTTSGWSHTYGGTNGYGTYQSTQSGSVSSNSVSFDSTAETAGSFNGAGQSSGALANYQVTVYVKGHPTVTIQTTGSGTGTITTGGGQAWANLPKTTAHDVDQQTVGTSSDSSSHSAFINLGCSYENTDSIGSFSEYPGVTYAVPTGYTNVAAGAGVDVDNYDAWTFDLDSSMSGGITVTIGNSSPVATISGPTVGGVSKPYASLGDSITFTNISYDPDNQNGTTAREGICSAAWTVTAPDGTVTNGSGLTSVTFTGSIPGTYNVQLLVTDNEGVTASAQASVDVEARDQLAGGGDGPLYCIAPDEVVCGWTNTGSGNAGMTYRDPVSTRGYPLATHVHLNSQTKFPTRTTKMGNGSFTYGIAVFAGSYTSKGVTQNRWIVADADGSEIDYGPSASAPAAQPGSYATLTTTTGGYELTNAGPPERIEKGGNYSYEFDSNGRLLSITDPSNNVQEVTYDTNGDPTTVTDLSSGRTIAYQYDTPGQIARIVEGGGEAVTHLSYSSGKLTGITLKDSLANTIRSIALTYDTNGRLSTVTQDGDSNSALTYSYQSAGNGVVVGNITHQGGGSNLSYFVAPSGTGVKYRTRKTTAAGGTITYDFDANMDLLKVTLPPHHGDTYSPTFTYTRDSWRNVASFNFGPSTYTFTRDSLGNITGVTNSWSGSWSYTYSGFDLLTATDPIGTYLTLGYTDTNNPHSPTTVTDAGGRTWTRTYNAYGQLTSVTPPSGSPSGAATYTYEENPAAAAFGYLVSVTNGAGDVESYGSYSPLGDILTSITSPSSGVTNTTTYSYDANRRLTELEHPDGKTFSLAYSGRNLSSTVDEAGTSNTFTWAAATGLLASVTGPLTHELSYAYNNDRQLSTFEDARANSTTYTYGNAGELYYATYPDSTQKEFTYDSFGRLKEIISPRSRVITAQYDQRSRLTRYVFTNPTQTELQWAYRGDDSLSYTTCWTGSTTYSYSTARQVSQVDNYFLNSGLSNHQYLIYTYNPDGSVATMQWKNGNTSVVTWTYSYDTAGRMTGVSNTFGESATYAYDGEGKITSQTNGNGTTTEYGYNQARGWLTSITHKKSGTAFASYALTYDGGANTVGNITGVTELGGSTVAYGYDALYRLTSETRTGTNAFSHTYGYDLAGNVTDLDGSTFATYDAANKISSLSGGTISHDGSGNVSAVNGAGISSSTFTFETRELMSTQTTGSTTITYNYDVWGKRLLMRPGSVSSAYVWYIFDGDRLVGEVGTGGPKVAYTWGPDGIVSERIFSGSKSRYYHFGPQGETRYTTDAAGNVANSYVYTAYGTTVASSGTDYNPHRYGGKVGYYTEGGAGLMLATYRWYSPHLMRWMSRDPIEYEGGENLYRYVDASPTNWVDPTGLQSIEVGPAVGGFQAPPPTVGSGPRTVDLQLPGAGAARAALPVAGAAAAAPEVGASILPWAAPAAVAAGGAVAVYCAHRLEAAYHEQIADWWLGPEVVPQFEMGSKYREKKRRRGEESGRGGHTKNKRPSTKGKHQQGDARRDQDAGGEKADVVRPKRPKGIGGAF